MAGMHWDKLSIELQQNVLLRVHWHDLCRCCAVCKKWNHMITEPNFAAQRPESCVLITAPRKVMTISDIDPMVVVNENDHEWHLLDIPANRMFSIPDKFIRKLRERMRLRAPGEFHVSRSTTAAGGGLIFALYRAIRNSNIVQAHNVVCNPVTMAFHLIPIPQPGCLNIDSVAMVVEVVGTILRYRIIQPRGFWNARLGAATAPSDFLLYDSSARVWRRLCQAPSAAHVIYSCVVLNGIFYVMFAMALDRRHELYSCDLVTGEWRRIDVSLPRRPLCPQKIKSRAQVVAASSCLFFVAYSGPAARPEGAVITVTIWRITLSERPKLTLEAQLPSFKSGLHLQRKCCVAATGCGDSIVVSTFRGRRVRWDVVRRTWFRSLPPFLPKTDDAACFGFFVGTMDLEMWRLPPQ